MMQALCCLHWIPKTDGGENEYELHMFEPDPHCRGAHIGRIGRVFRYMDKWRTGDMQSFDDFEQAKHAVENQADEKAWRSAQPTVRNLGEIVDKIDKDEK